MENSGSRPSSVLASVAELPQIKSQAIFCVSGPMKPLLKQSLDPALRSRPNDRGHTGVPTGSDLDEQGIAPNWAGAWPANRRILYNRASANVAGNAWNPAKPIIEWNGTEWVGIDVPDYGPTTKPSDGV